jgi:hypothetical protein
LQVVSVSIVASVKVHAFGKQFAEIQNIFLVLEVLKGQAFLDSFGQRPRGISISISISTSRGMLVA